MEIFSLELQILLWLEKSWIVPNDSKSFCIIWNCVEGTFSKSVVKLVGLVHFDFGIEIFGMFISLSSSPLSETIESNGGETDARDEFLLLIVSPAELGFETSAVGVYCWRRWAESSKTYRETFLFLKNKTLKKKKLKFYWLTFENETSKNNSCMNLLAVTLHTEFDKTSQTLEYKHGSWNAFG